VGDVELKYATADTHRHFKSVVRNLCSTMRQSMSGLKVVFNTLT